MEIGRGSDLDWEMKRLGKSLPQGNNGLATYMACPGRAFAQGMRKRGRGQHRDLDLMPTPLHKGSPEQMPPVGVHELKWPELEQM